jgi:hypothetical protein
MYMKTCNTDLYQKVLLGVCNYFLPIGIELTSSRFEATHKMYDSTFLFAKLDCSFYTDLLFRGFGHGTNMFCA